mgnify:CR=1 FL=1
MRAAGHVYGSGSPSGSALAPDDVSHVLRDTAPLARFDGVSDGRASDGDAARFCPGASSGSGVGGRVVLRAASDASSGDGAASDAGMVLQMWRHVGVGYLAQT